MDVPYHKRRTHRPSRRRSTCIPDGTQAKLRSSGKVPRPKDRVTQSRTASYDDQTSRSEFQRSKFEGVMNSAEPLKNIVP